MTNFLILISIVVNIIGLLILRSSKINKSKVIQQMLIPINEEEVVIEYFSKDVLDVYKSVINNPNNWILTDHLFYNKSDKIVIWAANDLDNREFYITPTIGGNIEEVKLKNKRLTYYDKVLLDKIIKAYKNKQNKIVTKFFI